MNRWAFIKETFVPENEAALPVQDLAIQRGYAVFDYFRLQGSHPLFLEQHLARFQNSAAGLGLALPYSLMELKSIVFEIGRAHV